jgi:uncharacterized integral membrane protein
MVTSQADMFAGLVVWMWGASIMGALIFLGVIAHRILHKLHDIHKTMKEE